MNRRACFFASAALLAIAPLNHAATWTSADAKVSFNLPDDGLFESADPVAPAEAIWTSKDGQTRIIFIVSDNPQNVPLELSGIVEGTVKSVKGLLISSSERTIGTVSAYSVAAKGSVNGSNVYLAQVLLPFGKKVYKVMVGGPTDVSRDPQMMALFSSVMVLDPSPLLPVARSASAVAMTGREADTNRLSVKIAEIAVWTLAIAGIVALVRRRTANPTPPTTPPAA